MAKKTLNTYTSKNSTSVSLEMSNTQDTFIPHWIVRFPSDMVADVVTGCDALKELQSKKDFIGVVVDALNTAYELDLKVDEYDFGAKHSREEVIARATAKAQAKADNTQANTEVNAWIKALQEALSVAVKNGVSVSVDMLSQKIENEVPQELQAQVKAHWSELKEAPKPSISSF